MKRLIFGCLDKIIIMEMEMRSFQSGNEDVTVMGMEWVRENIDELLLYYLTKFTSEKYWVCLFV